MSLNLPAGHLSHAPPSRPVKPASHVHAETFRLPSPDTEFAGHAAQALPVDNEKVLAGHLSHTLDVFAPMTDENFPTSHCTQCVAAAVDENLPTAQGMQTLAPNEALNVPGKQALQLTLPT